MPHRAAVVGLLAVAATSLSGCAAQTTIPYMPGNGVSAEVGTVQVRALVLVADAAGATASVSGVALNSGAATTAVMVRTLDEALATTPGPSVPVAAGGTARLDGTPVAKSPAAPGAMAKLVLSTPEAGDVIVLVPVVSRTGSYATVTPTAAATATP